MAGVLWPGARAVRPTPHVCVRARLTPSVGCVRVARCVSAGKRVWARKRERESESEISTERE